MSPPTDKAAAGGLDHRNHDGDALIKGRQAVRPGWHGVAGTLLWIER